MIHRKCLLGACLSAVVLHAGCAGTIADIAAEATPVLVKGAIEGSTEALAQPKVRADIAILANDPTLRRAVAQTTSSVVASVLDTMTRPERAERMGQAGALMLGEIVDSMTTQERAERMGHAGGVMFGAFVDAFVTPERVERLLGAPLRSAVNGLTESIRTEVGPALVAGINNLKSSASIRGFAYELTKGVMLGSADAIKEIEVAEEVTESVGWFGWFGAILATSVSVGLFLVGALLLTFLGMGMMVFRNSRSRRRMEADSARRETALYELVTALTARGRLDRDVKTRLQGLSEDQAEDSGDGTPITIHH